MGIFSAVSVILITLLSEDGISAIVPLNSPETYNRKIIREGKVNYFNLKVFSLFTHLVLSLTKCEVNLFETTQIPFYIPIIGLNNIITLMPIYCIIVSVNALLVGLLLSDVIHHSLKLFNSAYEKH